jgi:translation initiation factor 3 subunit F
MPALLLPTSGNHLSVRVHPVPLFAICDAYIRRNEKQDRVIGTLLGVVVDNVVEVKNCFVVPHNESSEQVGAIGSDPGAAGGRGSALGPETGNGRGFDGSAPRGRRLRQVMLDIAHHKTMFDLQQRVAPTEGIVGW